MGSFYFITFGKTMRKCNKTPPSLSFRYFQILPNMHDVLKKLLCETGKVRNVLRTSLLPLEDHKAENRSDDSKPPDIGHQGLKP